MWWNRLRLNAKRRPTIQPRCWQPSFECLEVRQMLAGNVIASLDSIDGLSVLRIDGDAAGNNVTLRGGATPGTIEVKGIGTTVNGGSKPVTFSGIDWLQVDVADGNDTVRGFGLSLLEIDVLAGAGNDTIELRGTTSKPVDQTYLNIYVFGDDSIVAPTETNGDDTITVANTTLVNNQSFIFTLHGDVYPYAPVGGHDTITLVNTSVTATADLQIRDINTIEIVGEAITVNGFNMTGSRVRDLSLAFVIVGSQVRFNNVDVSFQSETDAFCSTVIQAETVDVHNVNITSVTPLGGPGFNQVDMLLSGTTVRVNNLHTQGGGQSDFGFTGNFFQIQDASTVDVRNVSVTSLKGFASFNIYGSGFEDNSIYLANVTVSNAPGLSGFYSNAIWGGSGNDRVQIVNSTFDDSLAIYLGDGDDDLQVSNSSIGAFYAYLAEGSDRAVIKNNTFGIAEIYGGYPDPYDVPGFDTLEAKHNSGSITFFGFEG